MHLSLTKYAFHLEKKDYDVSIDTIDVEYDEILSNLKGTQPNTPVKQLEIILDLLKYNAIILKNNGTDIKLDNYINIDDINIAFFQTEKFTEKLLYLSLLLYMYDKDKDYDYSKITEPLTKHINYIKILINRYITNIKIKTEFIKWVNNYENEPDIVFDTIFDSAPKLIAECLIWSPFTQY